MSADHTVPVPQFTISRKHLASILKQVTRGCAKGSAAILNTCVMLDARPAVDGKPATLTLAATDLIVSVRSKIALMSCAAEGVFAIPGARLADVITGMRGGDEVTFLPIRKRDTMTVGVMTGRDCMVEFPYIDPSGFPHIYTSAEDQVTRHKVPSGELERALRNVKHASTAETASNFHGVFLSASPSAACAFSTPTSALTEITLPSGLLSPAGVLLPLSTCDTILGLCEQAPEVEIGIKSRDNGTPARVYLRDKSSEIAVMLPANVFPDKLPGQITGRSTGADWTWHRCRRDDLYSALKLMSTVLAGSKGDPVAAVSFGPGLMTLQAHGDGGTCDQEIACNTAEQYMFTLKPDGTPLDPPVKHCGMSITHLLAHLSTPAMQAAEEIEIGVNPAAVTFQYVRPYGAQAAKYLGVAQALAL